MKIFHRKTKRGSIVKIVREHYVRDDIPCGLTECKDCDNRFTFINEDNDCHKYLTISGRKSISKLISEPHIILVDSSIFFEQLDIIEDSSFDDNFVILNTVRNEIRSKNLSIYSRIKNQKTGRYVFVNEFHRKTYDSRKLGESSQDYNFRLVCIAAKWFKNHLGDKLRVVLLTNIERNKLIAIGNYDIDCYLLSEYVDNLVDNSNIIDKLSLRDNDSTMEDNNNNNNRILYPEHLAINIIKSRIEDGKLYQGKYQQSRDNYLEGFVNINRNNEDLRVLIQGREFINRAVHDDIVAIEILPENEWKTKMEVVLVDDIEINKDEVEGEENLENSSNNIDDIEIVKDRVITGKVVGIIKRNWRQYCGILRRRDDNLLNSLILTSHFFVPVERRIPIIRIESRQYEKLINSRIVVAIDSWPRNSKYPKGHYVRSLGEIGDKETENEMLLLEFDVPHLKFSKAAMKCLPDEKTFRILEDEIVKRTDLRNKNVCSVDPPGCTDIDDALHCELICDRIYEVGVHIADVSAFVKPGSALDLEARTRGTTVYLVDRRIHMLPEVLSSNLCSLVEGEDRLTFSVIWKMNIDTGEIIDTKFTKSIINSKGAFTYSDAQERIDCKQKKDDLSVSLRNLNKIAKKLKAKRLEKGALVLASAGEIRFVEVESETHDNMTRIESKEMKDTNSMIEEFMLLANISVAEKLFADVPQLALLRCHPKPNAANFDELIKAAKSRELEINVTDGKSLSESLNKAVDPKNPFLNIMLRMITTRCMTSAKYFCSGKVSDPEANFLHFGLATPMYTHFTSPIRRYADLIVHRELSHVLDIESIDSSLVSAEKIQSICENINYRHRQGQLAGRESVKLHTIAFIKSCKDKIIEDGYVMYIKKNALQIFIPKMAFEKTYFYDNEDDWCFDIDKNRVVHTPSNTSFRQFDPVQIELKVKDKSNEFRKEEMIDIVLLKPNIKIAEIKPSKPTQPTTSAKVKSDEHEKPEEQQAKKKRKRGKKIKLNVG